MGSTCMFLVFGAWLHLLGNFLFCHPQPLSSFPTPKTSSMHTGGEMLLDMRPEAQLSLPTYRQLPTGQGLVSHWLYGRLERSGKRVMSLFNNKEKMYLSQIFMLRCLNLCIWFSLIKIISTQCTSWYFVLWIGVIILSQFLKKHFVVQIRDLFSLTNRLFNIWLKLIFLWKSFDQF